MSDLRKLNPKQVGAFLGNPARVADTFAGEGWRPYVAPEHAVQWDAAVGGGAEAIAAALAEPDGWAHQLYQWAHTQQVCIRRGTTPDGRNYCSTDRYMGITAAATAYLVIALRSKGWQAERQAAAYEAPPVKHPIGATPRKPTRSKVAA